MPSAPSIHEPAPAPPSARPVWLVRVEIGCLWISLVVWTAASLRFVAGLAELREVVAGLAGALFGYLLADAVAGFVHWFADRFLHADTPWIGPALIGPFRAHHLDPSEMVRRDVLEVSGSNALATLPLGLVALALTPTGNAAGAFALGAWLSLGIALAMTNQLHRWAHAETPPAPVRALHALGLILTPERHARHHRGAHDRAYCVTSGWLNPVFDGLDLFARLERRIHAGSRHARRIKAR